MKLVKKQNIIHSMSKNNVPAYYMHSGETVAIETTSPGFTQEKFDEIKATENFPKRILSITGPIYVFDCKRGDTLRITIKDINLDKIGKMWSGQWIGYLMDELQTCFLKEVKVVGNEVIFDNSIKDYIQPMIGTIGIAPANEDVDCLVPGIHGGNMDVKELGIGSVLYLTAQVDGGLVSFGDVHATMGKGELLGTGVEIGSTVSAKIEVLKPQDINISVIENSDNYITVFSDKNVESACKELLKISIPIIMKANNLSYSDAYCFIGQFCDIGIAQLVNPLSTVTLTIPKRLLKNKFFTN